MFTTVVLQRDTVRAASEFAKRNQLPPRVQDQMLSHVCLKFKTEALKQQETLNSLPKAIRSSIAHYLFFPVVQNVSLFQGVSYDFLFQLVFYSLSLSTICFRKRDKTILMYSAKFKRFLKWKQNTILLRKM